MEVECKHINWCEVNWECLIKIGIMKKGCVWWRTHWLNVFECIHGKVNDLYIVDLIDHWALFFIISAFSILITILGAGYPSW